MSKPKPKNKHEHGRILASALRKFGRITQAVQKHENRPLNGKKLPLGFRRFRRLIRKWPAERAQMSQLLEWHEVDGLSIKRCYFKALKNRMKNLRTGAEICMERVRQMIAAEQQLQEEETREIAAQLVQWADDGNSLAQIRYAALKKELWSDADKITLDQIQEIIDHERQHQQKEQSHATQQ